MSIAGLLQFKVIQSHWCFSDLAIDYHHWVIKPSVLPASETIPDHVAKILLPGTEHRTPDEWSQTLRDTENTVPCLWKTNHVLLQPTLTACLHAKNSLKVWLKLVRTWQQRCFPAWRTLYINSLNGLKILCSLPCWRWIFPNRERERPNKPISKQTDIHKLASVWLMFATGCSSCSK